MKLAALPGVLCLLLAAMPTHAQQRNPDEVVTRHVSTPAGRPVLVRRYASWRPDCAPRGEPVVTVDPQPQHGIVPVRSGMSTIREYIGNASQCVGQQVPGTTVWYRPTPGFQGMDQFGMTISMTHVIRDLALVEVR